MDTRTKLNVLSICSGIGGIELGLHAALDGRTRTVCYVERELSVASILAARMQDGTLDSAPIWTDLRTFDPEPWRGKVDILAGGFPCQPHSVAGNKLGEDDPRELSGEVLRIANGLGLPELFLENVPGILRFYWDSIRPELRAMGYQVAEGLFTASETGAPHRRERLFILANTGEPGIWDQARTAGGGTRLSDVRQGDGTTGTVRPSSTGVDDSEGNIRRTPGDAGRGASDRPSDNELAHAEHEGHSQRLRPKTTSQRGRQDLDGEELAHAECQRTQVSVAGEYATEQRIDCNCEELAHTRSERLERVRSSRQEEYQERPEDVPLYPPGPSDNEGWAWLLDRWPELAPTVCKESPLQYEMSQIECQFCGSPDGPTQELPTEVLLRAIGNGVVPAVAAIAFRTLSKALNQTLQSV